MGKRDTIWAIICVNALVLSWLYWRGELKEADRQNQVLQAKEKVLRETLESVRAMNSRLP